MHDAHNTRLSVELSQVFSAQDPNFRSVSQRASGLLWCVMADSSTVRKGSGKGPGSLGKGFGKGIMPGAPWSSLSTVAQMPQPGMQSMVYGFSMYAAGYAPAAWAHPAASWTNGMHTAPWAATATTSSLFDGRLTACAICLEDFAHGNLAARLGCRHCFHKSCYDSLVVRAQPGSTPECPICRGAEPLVTTFTYRGPDTYDEAQRNFVAATEALDEVREQLIEVRTRLDSALLRNGDLQDALDMTQAELLSSRRSYRMSKEELWDLEDEHRAVTDKLRATYAAHAEQGRQQRLRAILAQVGGKAGRLAADPTVSLCTVAYSLVAQRRRMSNLLLQATRSTRALVTAEEGHASAVAGLKKTIAAMKEERAVDRREQATLRKRVREAEASARQEGASKDALIERLTAQQDGAAQKIEALDKKLAQLDRKAARSKEKADKLYWAKEDVQNALGSMTARRDEAVEQLARQLRASTPSCSVCMEEAAGGLMVLLPCGHACVCKSCGISLEECPMCRSTIEDRASIFICYE